jgi:CBS domain containing-hemolysin-like protein
VTLLPWLIVGLLLAVNALYVAAQFSAVAVPRPQLARMAKDGHKLAAELHGVVEDSAQLDRYMSACQIGITLSSLMVGAYGQASIGVELRPLLETSFGLVSSTAASAAAAAVLFILTASQIVLGELVPKALALQFPARIALLTFLPTRASMSLYRWFIWLLNGSSMLLLKPFKIASDGHHHVHSPDEIELLFGESRRGGRLTIEVHNRLQRGLRLNERTVRQLMVPRSQLEAIEVATPTAELIRRVLSSPYSRLPVYEKTLDQVLGAVSVKDLVGFYATRGGLPSLRQALRPIPFVPETLSADKLVRFFQEQRNSQAIVVDEYGGVQGLVSIEDVLSEVFGEVGDELLPTDASVERMPDGRLRVPGDITLSDAERWIGTRLHGETSTLGGYIVETLRRLPAAGEKVTLDGVELTVLEMSPTAVRWIAVEAPGTAGQAGGAA